MQATFCDKFTAYADKWEETQEALIAQPFEKCDVCEERRPPWMTTVRCVDRMEKGLRSDDLAKHPKYGGADAAARWDAFVRDEIVGPRLKLCDRCRAPSVFEKACRVFKFSAANRATPRPIAPVVLQGCNAAAINTHLKKEPFGVLAREVDALLRRNPEKAFALATDAEFALVRMTIPWLVLSPCASFEHTHPPPPHTLVGQMASRGISKVGTDGKRSCKD